MIKIAISFTFGAISSYAMAPHNLWPTLFLGLSILYVLVDRAPNAKKAALIGFAYSLGYSGFGLSWVANALLVEGNPYGWAWPLAVCGLPLILSPFTALMCALHKTISQKRHVLIKYISFTITLFLAELGRGHLFTGFPWNLYGYTWIEIKPIANAAHIFTIYFLTFLTISWTITPALLANKKAGTLSKLVIFFWALGSFTTAFIYGQNHISKIEKISADDKKINIAIIQPNIKQSEKWKPEKQSENFQKLLNLTREAAAKLQKQETENTTLFVWPETAIANNVINSDWATSQIIETLSLLEQDTYLLTGALRYKEKDQYFNSIMIFDKAGEIINTYNKSHLVPFGEYMPLSEIIDIAPIVGFQGFQRGEDPSLLTLNETLNIFPLICYEVIFPHKTFQKLNDKNTGIIVNVTNDAWYGNSAGPYQHLVQAQFRAIENQTVLIRSANTGISAIISPTGVIKDSLGLQTGGTILNQIRPP